MFRVETVEAGSLDLIKKIMTNKSRFGAIEKATLNKWLNYYILSYCVIKILAPLFWQRRF